MLLGIASGGQAVPGVGRGSCVSASSSGGTLPSLTINRDCTRCRRLGLESGLDVRENSSLYTCGDSRRILLFCGWL